MVNEIRTVYPGGLNKEFVLKFCEGYRVWQTPEEGHQPKCYVYSHKEENNCQNILNINYQASFQKI